MAQKVRSRKIILVWLAVAAAITAAALIWREPIHEQTGGFADFLILLSSVVTAFLALVVIAVYINWRSTSARGR